MKNRLLLVMLISALLMSPTFAFADTPDEAAGNEAVTAQAAGDNVDVPEQEDVVADSQLEISKSDLSIKGDHAPGWNADRTEYYDADGNLVKGLFKEKLEVASETGALFYSDDNGKVKKTIDPVVVDGSKKRYKWNPVHDGFDPVDDSDKNPYAYFFTNEGRDYYVQRHAGMYTCSSGTFIVQDNGTVNMSKNQVVDFEGAKYFLQENFSVKTTQGVATAADGSKYYVLNGGKVQTTVGCVFDGGTMYYVQAGGKIQTTEGLVQHTDGRVFYVQPNAEGKIKTTEGWITFNGKKYYATPGGAILTTPGVHTIDNKKYLVQNDWSICFKKGIAAAGGNLYYVKDSSGTLYAKKEVKSGKKRYHVQSNCIVAVGPHKWKKKLYFSTTAGYLQKKTAILAWGGHYYHVNNKGLVTKNKQIKFKKKWYIANKSGTLKTGFFKWKKGLYYANAKGAIRTKQGKYVINGYTYYIGSKGRISVNQQFKGKDGTYKSDENGRLVSGIYTWKKKYYYADPDYRLHKTEEILRINKKYYYNKKGGGLAKNKFFDYKGNHYYAGSDAAILTSAFSYKGYVVHPTSTGIISDDEYYKIFPDKKPKTDDDGDSTNTNN